MFRLLLLSALTLVVNACGPAGAPQEVADLPPASHPAAPVNAERSPQKDLAVIALAQRSWSRIEAARSEADAAGAFAVDWALRASEVANVKELVTRGVLRQGKPGASWSFSPAVGKSLFVEFNDGRRYAFTFTTLSPTSLPVLPDLPPTGMEFMAAPHELAVEMETDTRKLELYSQDFGGRREQTLDGELVVGAARCELKVRGRGAHRDDPFKTFTALQLDVSGSAVCGAERADLSWNTVTKVVAETQTVTTTESFEAEWMTGEDRYELLGGRLTSVETAGDLRRLEGTGEIVKEGRWVGELAAREVEEKDNTVRKTVVVQLAGGEFEIRGEVPLD